MYTKQTDSKSHNMSLLKDLQRNQHDQTLSKRNAKFEEMI